MKQSQIRDVTPRRPLVISSILLLFIVLLGFQADAQVKEEKANPKENREFGLTMLSLVKKVLKDHYYDPTYHGIDIDKRFKLAEQEIQKEDRRWQMNRTIAQVLLDLNDSHTSYFPPAKLYDADYGFSMMMMGPACYVLNVRKTSDAEAKGLVSGDEVLEVNGLDPVKDSLWVINYIIHSLDPQDTLNVKIRKGDGSTHELTIQTRYVSQEENEKRLKVLKDDAQLKPYTCSELDPDLIACKLRSFAIESLYVDKMMKEVGSHKKMILDLRGNGGGLIDTEERLLGYFFDHDVKVATQKMRTKSNELIAKGRKDNAYSGDLAVLLDSRSASASEIFARVVQIEKRGIVIGDVSAGAVMESYRYPLSPDADDPWMKFTLGTMSVTIADVIMSDRGRIEGKGVIPDFPVFPNRTALEHRLDPVLAYAAQKMGSKPDIVKISNLHFLVPRQLEDIPVEADTKKKDKDGKSINR